jgi:hypothetical protein
MRKIALALLVAASAAQSQAPAPPKPLFASEEPIRFVLRGAIMTIASAPAGTNPTRPATLVLAAPAESLTVQLSPRGKSRRLEVTCEFAPIRVDFTSPPPAASLFAGQRRLKLVTHCRQSAAFQQHTLLEYAAYRMYNAITPHSLRARLATVDYQHENGKPIVSRAGIFLEEFDDAARRNGFLRPNVPDRIAVAQLDGPGAARVALFEYMIGNLDWAITAGPRGEGCCHNTRLTSDPRAPGKWLPVPYDFDYSGLVDAPYAVPPPHIGGDSVRTRVWRGHCRYNGDVVAVAAEYRAKRPAIEAALTGVPGLSDRSRAKALSYLAGFYRDIASDEALRSKLLSRCLK